MGAADRLPGPPGCQDQSFGPFAGYHCRGGMDFTLRFEESILVIPLQCILLAILPFRLMKLAKTESKVRWGILQPFKLVSTCQTQRLHANYILTQTTTDRRSVLGRTECWTSRALVHRFDRRNHPNKNNHRCQRSVIYCINCHSASFVAGT